MSSALSLPSPVRPGAGSRPEHHLHRPHAPSRSLVVQLVEFSGVGAAATGLQLGLYLVLRAELGPLTANLLAMVLSTAFSIEANRRLTFRRRGHDQLTRQYLGSLAVFAVGTALSSAALRLLTTVDPVAGQGAELATLLASAALVGLLRFALLRHWVFGGGHGAPGVAGTAAETHR